MSSVSIKLDRTVRSQRRLKAPCQCVGESFDFGAYENKKMCLDIDQNINQYNARSDIMESTAAEW